MRGWLLQNLTAERRDKDTRQLIRLPGSLFAMQVCVDP